MARIQHFDQGDVWRVQATFKVGTTPTDPTNVTVRVMDPSKTVTVAGPVSGGAGGSGIVRDSVGVFHFDVILNDAGYWYCRFEGTGAAAATEDHQAIVDPSMFFEDAQLVGHALVGMSETKDWMQQQNIVTENDLELAAVINDVSARFSFEAGREFKRVGADPQTRLIPIDQLYALTHGEVRIGDMASAPTLVRVLASDWTTVSATLSGSDWRAEPAVRNSWDPITRLRIAPSNSSVRQGSFLEVTGTFGFPAVPGNVRLAVLQAVAATLDRDAEHYTLDQSSTGSNDAEVVSGSFKPWILSLPPMTMAVARAYSDPLVA